MGDLRITIPPTDMAEVFIASLWPPTSSRLNRAGAIAEGPKARGCESYLLLIETILKEFSNHARLVNKSNHA